MKKGELKNVQNQINSANTHSIKKKISVKNKLHIIEKMKNREILSFLIQKTIFSRV